eukprot:COSAG01_NODE_2819_length_7012_cov_41.860697_6_plen_87_part_00
MGDTIMGDTMILLVMKISQVLFTSLTLNHKIKNHDRSFMGAILQRQEDQTCARTELLYKSSTLECTLVSTRLCSSACHKEIAARMR